MPEIVLSTLNAKYIHSAFGLRYLLANLGSLKPRACIREFDIRQRPVDIAEAILALEPRIVGFGVYIWNVALTTEVLGVLKRLRPEIVAIIGGPEVSYEWERQPIVQLADHVITGEADLTFGRLCDALLGKAAAAPGGEGSPPKMMSGDLPDFSQLILPYDLYTDEDIAHRIIYVEASRGCPFTCEFCLSSLDIPVRQAPLPLLLDQLQRLMDRGVNQFKFVDRTFNLSEKVSRTILEFFLDRYRPGQFFHFELVPDRLPAALRQVIARFPSGALQFEIGIQTFDEAVGERIHRRQNYDRLEENMRFLRRETGAHIHADLIAGLPGEKLEGFGDGFDRLMALGPQEIQVGILKRLRGTPIVRHDSDWEMVYNPHPPYELLQNKSINFVNMQRLRRFARYWDLVGNSGNFVETVPLLWSGGASPFRSFLRCSDWLHDRVGRTDAIALMRLMELLFEFLVNELKLEPAICAERMWRDYQRGGRYDKPLFLKAWLGAAETNSREHSVPSGLPKRQARHLGQISANE